jgi:glyoxylase-like metal-dependent hydrolase (beta-lactamase superfamily II)
LISRTGAGFLVDCGNRRVMEEVRRMQRDGGMKQLDGIYITHYHDDHTGMAQAAADEFRCPLLPPQPELSGAGEGISRLPEAGPQPDRRLFAYQARGDETRKELR